MSHLEVWSQAGSRLVALSEHRVVIGSADGSDVQLPDETVSRVHAAIQPAGGGWTVADLGSRNGTFVNGERLAGERALRPGDELRLGDCRIVFRVTGSRATFTKAADPPPELTARERDVVVALCRPVLSGTMLTEPASIGAIAAELVITESAVKKHLTRLFDKFDLPDDERRRGRLAGEAIKRGSVSTADLR